MRVVSTVLSIALAGVASCADPSAEPRLAVATSEVVTPSCECGSQAITIWSPATTNYWQAGANNMMLVLHRADTAEGAPAAFFGWLVANGVQVKAVYRVPRTSFAQFIAAVTDSFASNA